MSTPLASPTASDHPSVQRYQKHVNPAFVKLLGAFGYGRVFVRAKGTRVWDHEGRVRRWEGQAERLFGWTAAEAVGRHALEVAPPHPDDAAGVKELVRDVLASRRPRAMMRNRNLTD